MNQVSLLAEGWEGIIHFFDGSSIQSAHSYGGMLNGLEPPLITNLVSDDTW